VIVTVFCEKNFRIECAVVDFRKIGILNLENFRTKENKKRSIPRDESALMKEPKEN